MTRLLATRLITLLLCWSLSSICWARDPVALADQCVITITAPEDASVTLDGQDYGTGRRLLLSGLAPGKQRASLIRIRFAEGGEAQRTVLVAGGGELALRVMAPTRIVFESMNSKAIWAINSVGPDGGDLKQLSPPTVFANAPQISPDGSRIAYNAWHEHEAHVNVMNVDGNGVTSLAKGLKPSWTPDGRRILFQSKNGGLFVMDADGTNVRLLTDLGAGVFEGHSVDWSPDSQRFVFSFVRLGSPNTTIYIFNFKDGKQQQLTTGSHPKWSPDGNAIAFHRRSYLDADAVADDLYVLRLDTGRTVQLGSGGFAAWSPAGDRLVLVDQGNLFLVDPTGTNRRQLTQYESKSDIAEEASNPQWSPDGRQIVFTLTKNIVMTVEESDRMEEERSMICTINADGSGLGAVSRESYSDSWSYPTFKAHWR